MCERYRPSHLNIRLCNPNSRRWNPNFRRLNPGNNTPVRILGRLARLSGWVCNGAVCWASRGEVRGANGLVRIWGSRIRNSEICVVIRRMRGSVVGVPCRLFGFRALDLELNESDFGVRAPDLSFGAPNHPRASHKSASLLNVSKRYRPSHPNIRPCNPNFRRLNPGYKTPVRILGRLACLSRWVCNGAVCWVSWGEVRWVKGLVQILGG